MHWSSMKKRCSSAYFAKWYSDRGITICEEWKNSFTQFLADMGEAPPGMELDRIDNNGNYCKENCRWVTHLDNSRNKAKVRLLTINGVTKPLVVWAEEHGFIGVIPYGAVYRRLKRGWPIEKLFLPSPGQPSQRTACPQGHAYTPENTVMRHRGKGRSCRACETLRSSAAAKVRKEQRRLRRAASC